MRGRRGTAGAVLAAVGMLAAAGCQPIQPWRSELVTPNGDGTGGSVGYVDFLTYSPDGTKLAFVTDAGDLGPTDTNGNEDVYVRDLVSGTTTLVSVNAAGTDAGNGLSRYPTFGPDGRTLAFESDANDLDPDRPGDRGIFVRDLVAGTTRWLSLGQTPVHSPTDDAVVANVNGQVAVIDVATRDATVVSTTPDGAPGNGESQVPTISPDGRRVAFQSYATDLDPRIPDPYEGGNVFVHDLATGETELVSVNAAGTAAGDRHSYIGWPYRRSFSPDGSQLLFTSLGSDLVTNDGDPGMDVFVRDLDAGTTELVSVDATGTSSNGESHVPMFSPDGTKVAFASTGNDIVPGDDNGYTFQAYVRDLEAGTTVRISQNAAGTGGGRGDSGWPGWEMATGEVFSPDGTKVVFPSVAGDLGARDSDRCADPNYTEACRDVYVHDLETGTTTLVSANAAGDDSGNAHSWGGVFSPVGDTVAYVSAATDLGPPGESGAGIQVATLTGADVSATLAAAPDPVPAGGTVTWTLTVANAGPEAAPDAVAALRLPDGTSFAGVTTTAGTCAPPAAEHPGLVTCAFGDAPPGPVAEVTVTATVTADAGTTLEAIARVASGARVDPAPRNDVATTTTPVT